jgi:hypothetical protein
MTPTRNNRGLAHENGAIEGNLLPFRRAYGLEQIPLRTGPYHELNHARIEPITQGEACDIIPVASYRDRAYGRR